VCTVFLPASQKIDVPFASIFAAVMGSCSARPTAVLGVWNQAAGVVQTLPSSIVNATLALATGNGGSTDGGYSISVGGVVPRTALQTVLVNVGINLGDVLATFLLNLGGVLSCDALNRSINAVKNAVCCDTMTALFWFVSSWYLIAFSMCCCGFPASVMGYKRLPNELWGPEKEIRSRAHGHGPDADAAEDIDQARQEQWGPPPQSQAPPESGSKRSLARPGNNRASARSPPQDSPPGYEQQPYPARTMVPPSYLINPVGSPAGRPGRPVGDARGQYPPTAADADPAPVQVHPPPGHRLSVTAVHPLPPYMAAAEQYAPPQRAPPRNPYASPGYPSAPAGPAPGARGSR
jgi:hypothetical protein